MHTLERRFWGVEVGVNLPYSAFFFDYLFFQRRTDYNQIHYPTNMVSNLEDAVKGNNNTKIVHLLELLKMQLDRIERKIEELE